MRYTHSSAPSIVTSITGYWSTSPRRRPDLTISSLDWNPDKAYQRSRREYAYDQEAQGGGSSESVNRKDFVPKSIRLALELLHGALHNRASIPLRRVQAALARVRRTSLV